MPAAAPMLDEASFTVFDVETTGLYPYYGDRICEIGAIRVDGIRAETARKFHSMIDPLRPISYAAFSVNGITDGMVRGSPTIDRVLPGFMEFIKESTLVAYNAGFDLGFIEHSLGEDKVILEDYFIIDALTLARRLFPGLGRYNLGSVSRSLGIRPAGEHRALSDALLTWKVFEKELELLAAEGRLTVEEIAAGRLKKAAAARKVGDYKTAMIERAIREQKDFKMEVRYGEECGVGEGARSNRKE